MVAEASDILAGENCHAPTKKSKWRANNIADIGGANGKVVEHVQIHMSMKFCVDLTYGVGLWPCTRYPLL
uniref:Uncharacterized protein n=1 Tax=Anguilla anguilla TaxID=7936 RepID=A0A0E9QMR0_ANGAN